uniref:Uncharacterized protein n=1 Tax=Cyanothece sp. (strain PCC 7425 / ATCC 29141) TaxID=395961 RepID=B8HKE3_CYAP4
MLNPLTVNESLTHPQGDWHTGLQIAERQIKTLNASAWVQG